MGELKREMLAWTSWNDSYCLSINQDAKEAVPPAKTNKQKIAKTQEAASSAFSTRILPFFLSFSFRIMDTSVSPHLSPKQTQF